MSDENDIYVNVVDDDGMCAWYNRNEDGQTYLYDAAELVDPSTDEFAGTPCRTPDDAKTAGRKALSLASFDGSVRPRVRYFIYAGYRQVEVKFMKDGKIEATGENRFVHEV